MQIDKNIAAVVTGGASGLGKASVQALARAGAKVAIFDLNEEAGTRLAQEVGGVFCKVDILNEESVLAGFEKARAAHGQERICVHCAVVCKGARTVSKNKETGQLKRMTTEDFAFSAQGVLIASYRVASISALGMAAAEPLEDGERGVIILTSSTASMEPQIGQVAYGALKAGVNGLVLSMARDLMDNGIRVNSILPGIFATPPMLGVPAKVLEGLAASVPFPKRLGKPEEFGSLVLEMSRNLYFNGNAVRLDGALRMAAR
ncbi:MAG TPA: SDR family NAD(P)-dependent oxidoreductase [Steroidobacteraceae bacterium]|jgi:NAD(P)-dependent dehydrogenase (short-subunit alcohol dehydrogenase family)|nr:SDR family NAD(P)-dependent oxidoreductase [Steroidobacteraceae bacterium]